MEKKRARESQRSPSKESQRSPSKEPSAKKAAVTLEVSDEQTKSDLVVKETKNPLSSAAMAKKTFVAKKASSEESPTKKVLSGDPQVKKPAAVAPWRAGLLQALDDESLHVYSDEEMVVIRDKYPKARHHLLVLPRAHLSDLEALGPTHLPLLERMEAKAKVITAGLEGRFPFQYGYHGVPSMSHVHLHAISQDFQSPCLKTKKHWNSFTTEYFYESANIIEMLRGKGAIRLDRKALLEMLKMPLRCHRCGSTLPTMPKLKEHIKLCQLPV